MTLQSGVQSALATAQDELTQLGAGEQKIVRLRSGKLNQLLIVMGDGGGLAEHNNPGEATVFVLAGEVSISSASTSATGRAGELIGVPDERHELIAHGPAAVLLSYTPIPT